MVACNVSIETNNGYYLFNNIRLERILALPVLAELGIRYTQAAATDQKRACCVAVDRIDKCK